MSKRSRLPQFPRHILIFNEDWEYLETRFGPQGIKPVGISNVIRALIHKQVLAWREAENAVADSARRQQQEAENPEEDQPDVNSPDLGGLS